MKTKLGLEIDWDATHFTTYGLLQFSDLKRLTWRSLLNQLDVTDPVKLSKQEKKEVEKLCREIAVALKKLDPKVNRVFKMLDEKIIDSRKY